MWWCRNAIWGCTEVFGCIGSSKSIVEINKAWWAFFHFGSFCGDIKSLTMLETWIMEILLYGLENWIFNKNLWLINMLQDFDVQTILVRWVSRWLCCSIILWWLSLVLLVQRVCLGCTEWIWIRADILKVRQEQHLVKCTEKVPWMWQRKLVGLGCGVCVWRQWLVSKCLATMVCDAGRLKKPDSLTRSIGSSHTYRRLVLLKNYAEDSQIERSCPNSRWVGGYTYATGIHGRKPTLKNLCRCLNFHCSFVVIIKLAPCPMAIWLSRRWVLQNGFVSPGWIFLCFLQHVRGDSYYSDTITSYQA